MDNSSRDVSYRRPVQGRALARLARPLIPASLALFAGACATTSDDTTTATVAAPATTGSLPREAFDYVGWDAYLGGQESSQYTALNQITKDNVNQLQVAWTYETGAGQPPQFNPIVANGMMYVTRGDGKVIALDPATGREIWVSAEYCEDSAPPR